MHQNPGWFTDALIALAAMLNLGGPGVWELSERARTKTVLTDNCAPVEIEVPRDRNGRFDATI